VLIETVGVGQSETVVAQMSDLFLLLLAPAGGDELQGVKRGIMEMADIILVNKADGDLKPVAQRTCSDYSGALRLMRKRPQDPDGFPKAMMVSALEEQGLQDAWAAMQELDAWRREHGFFDGTRSAQAQYWFEEDVRASLLAQLDQGEVRDEMRRLGSDVAAGRLDPAAAAKQMLIALQKP
jgi:LAO/AO transport system kinase